MSLPLFVSERSKPKITTQPLSVGCLIFARMDQIDFTGPFEVLSRMPDTSIQIIGKEVAPVRDVQGLLLSPDVSIAKATLFDVLLVPGGYGQQALMHDEEVLELIRNHVQQEKLLFSVCTGALLCGAAGVLMGRQVTTHWSARHLMRYYGAQLVDARVAVDGNIISAAGVTAGLDAAFALVSLLRGDAAAQEIQLAIEYAPNPIFHSGTPESAPSEVLKSFQKKYKPIGTAREAEAIRVLIEQAYSAFNKRNIDGALALMTQDVSWPKASEGGKVVGKEKVRAYWTRQWGEFDPHVEPLAVTVRDGGKVSVRVHQLVKNLQGNLLSDSEVLHVFTVNSGLIAAMDLGDEDDASAGPTAAFAHRS
jgi:cyclohexyl-isocyanide hydratase